MNKAMIRIICLLLAGLMLLSLIAGVAAYTGVAGWAEADISAMDSQGLIPDSLKDADLSKPISRLDMSRIAVLSFEKLTGESVHLPVRHPFSDTEDSDAEKAYSAGIISGDGNGTFRPEDNLTRLEFFVIVARFLEALGVPVNEEDYASLEQFSDTDTLPGWGEAYASLTVGMGIVNGTGSALNWAGTTSCQEAIVLFYRTYNKAVERLVAYENMAPWAAEAIGDMDSLGLIPHRIKFAPMNGSISRQDLCKLLMNTYSFITGVTADDLGTPEDPFTDTDDVDVLNAHRLGVVNGKGSGTFSPAESITRQDFFKMTVNFLSAIGFPYTDDETVSLEGFSDADQLAEYAAGSARLLVGLGIVNGTSDNRLNPRDNIARQEALVIFYRVFCFVTGGDNTPEEPTEPDVPTDPTEEPTEPTEEPTEPTEAPSDPDEDELPLVPVDPTEPSGGAHPGQDVVEYAKTLLGCDYVAGGKKPEVGFDCSGFVYYVYKNFGYTLNPGATNQWKHLSDEIIPKDQLIPGDLVFFSSNGDVSGMTHVGIYVGDGQFIHAENYQNGVTITDLDQRYYAQRYLGAKRVIE